MNTAHGFPPIKDHVLLADGETTALVSSRGAIEWLCAPRSHSPTCSARSLTGTLRLIRAREGASPTLASEQQPMEVQR
ncbi:trehalase-like domain-containing protein [Dermatophilaceae bacterium Sec6.4]